MAADCQRVFNKAEYKKTADHFADHFASILEGFYQGHGPWQITVESQKIDADKGNVDYNLALQIVGFTYSETLRLHVNEEFKIDQIIADLQPRNWSPTFKVGIDEYLNEPGPKLNANNFQAVFNFTSEQREAFRQKALAYYGKQFGIDTAETAYDETTGITAGSYFKILPIQFGGNYYVQESLCEKLPSEINGVKTRIEIAEYVLIFDDIAKDKKYGGDYSPDKSIPIDLKNNISFGMYRLIVGDGRQYEIEMQSKVPNQIVSDRGHVLVKLALQSKEFGVGEGAFVALMDTTKPSDSRGFKTYVTGNWHFPNLQQG